MEPTKEPAQDIATAQEKPLMQRLLKYLPVFMISHIFVTIPTFVISLTLAYATYVQADATRKIQQSETWPYVSYGTDNSSPDGKPEISMSLTNNGVVQHGLRRCNSSTTASRWRTRATS